MSVVLFEGVHVSQRYPLKTCIISVARRKAKHTLSEKKFWSKLGAIHILRNTIRGSGVGEFVTVCYVGEGGV